MSISPMWIVILSQISHTGDKTIIVASFCKSKSLRAQAPLNMRRTPDSLSHSLFTICPKTGMSKWKQNDKNIWRRYLDSSMFGSRHSPPCIHLPVDNLRPSSGSEIISFSTRRRNRSQILHHNSPAEGFSHHEARKFKSLIYTARFHCKSTSARFSSESCDMSTATHDTMETRCEGQSYQIQRLSPQWRHQSFLTSLSILWFSWNKLSSLSINILQVGNWIGLTHFGTVYNLSSKFLTLNLIFKLVWPNYTLYLSCLFSQ